MNTVKVLLIVIVLIVFGYIAAAIDLPLPEGVFSNSNIESHINNCTFEVKGGGKYSELYNLAVINLTDESTPILKWNPSDNELVYLKSACKNKSKVNIWYKASSTLLRPKVSFWVTSVVYTET
jgi:hypothetical protein